MGSFRSPGRSVPSLTPRLFPCSPSSLCPKDVRAYIQTSEFEPRCSQGRGFLLLQSRRIRIRIVFGSRATLFYNRTLFFAPRRIAPYIRGHFGPPCCSAPLEPLPPTSGPPQKAKRAAAFLPPFAFQWARSQRRLELEAS